MTATLGQRLAAETLGAALLLAIVVGSGIMAERLAGGNEAVALLGNTLATAAGLFVLILIFGPVSGAHFNPAVTLVFALRREIAPGTAAAYAGAQFVGAVCGVALAHVMFDLPAFETSTTVRAGAGQIVGEAVATFFLVLTILGAVRWRPQAAPAAVALAIAAGYWFTSSTSFANPAVTAARTLTDTFAGVRPADAPGFMAGEVLGALGAMVAAGLLFSARGDSYRPADAGAASSLSTPDRGGETRSRPRAG
jgi:glycerol uptake facilitator-like aquaporin